MLIGVGERRDGLYFFSNLPQIKATKVDRPDSLNLWHQWLGHPSLKITKLLSLIDYKKTGLLDDHCDICLWSKQNQNKFSSSENKVFDMFELIRYDLWGP